MLRYIAWVHQADIVKMHRYYYDSYADEWLKLEVDEQWCNRYKFILVIVEKSCETLIGLVFILFRWYIIIIHLELKTPSWAMPMFWRTIPSEQERKCIHPTSHYAFNRQSYFRSTSYSWLIVGTLSEYLSMFTLSRINLNTMHTQ